MTIKRSLGKVLHISGPTIKGSQLVKKAEPLGTACNPPPEQGPPQGARHPSPRWGRKEASRAGSGKVSSPNNCPHFHQLTLNSACTNSLLEMQMCPGRVRPKGFSEKNKVFLWESL